MTISSLSETIERKIEESEVLFLTFLNLKRHLIQWIIWKCLRELEIPRKLCQVIKSMYKTDRGKVQIAGKRSENFDKLKTVI